MHCKPRAKAQSADHLLAGKLFCECGERMVGTAGTSRNGRVYRYYVCPKRLKRQCASERIPSEALERQVVEGVQDILRDQDAFDAIFVMRS
jgi:hypothetical protein